MLASCRPRVDNELRAGYDLNHGSEISHGPRVVGDGLDMRLSGGPDAAATARRGLSQLRSDIDPPLMETLRLLVTELVTNAVKHAAASTVTLKVVVGRASVLTEVTDEGPGFDPAQTGTPRDSHGGWGLFLVERLAVRWGVSRNGSSTRVWFELRRG
jgi:anti-sigma regulatory factor (Ser/Thr protein kinase)